MGLMKSALGQMARTVAVVLPLGLALYLGLLAVAGISGVQFWLVLVLLLPFGVLQGLYLANALRHGRIAVWREEIVRARQPARYALWMSWFVLIILLSLALCLYAAFRLLAMA